MSITRKFLGFDSPPLVAAADYLIDRYRRRRDVVMSEAVVVTPGGRAGRRLLELLVQAAASQGLALTPPTIITVGQLPEQLYAAQRPLAGPLLQHLAWAKVLRETRADALRPVLPHPPRQEDFLAWFEIGRLFARQHTELAADGLNFKSVVACLKRMATDAEADRWSAMAEVQAKYLGLLDDLQVWDAQTARMVAVDQLECDTARHIELIGAVDMTTTLRRMLDQVDAYVTALVVAPEDWSNRFDEYGCLALDPWEQAEIRLDAARLHVADGPTSQADRVARCLAAYQGAYRADEITIGLADEGITTHIQRQLDQVGIVGRSARGTSVTRNPACRLLEAVGAFLAERRFADLAALARHPDVCDWLSRQSVADDWIERLDEFHHRRLPRLVDENRQEGDGAEAAAMIVFRKIAEWLAPLSDESQRLDAWCDPMRAVLREVYGHRTWDRGNEVERAYLQTLEQIHKVLITMETEIPDPLLPSMGAADAIWMIRNQLQSATLAESIDPDAVELVGWLELPLDDAPAVIVTSFNEGYVPSTVNSDMFLPDSLRSELGLVDNRRRYARDAYATSVLLASHEQVDLVIGRRTPDGDPLAPSRLLFATDTETIARRAATLFAAPQPIHDLSPLAGGATAGRETSGFLVPRPKPLERPIDQLRVTAFKAYLECPYRFYLSHVLRLETVDDAAEELDGGRFGSVLHDVLQVFGAGPTADSENVEEIQAALDQLLDEAVEAAFPAGPRAAVRIQFEQMRTRLHAFAEKQADWVSAGWKIEHVEASGPERMPAFMEVDGQPFGLRGRIDRIDRNRETGEWAVLDYKSSDRGQKPESVHRRAGQWIDLQLPLYRHLASSLGVSGPLKLGYILLPKDVKEVQFCLANWKQDELKAADETARKVIRAIRAEHFWPPTDPPPRHAEALSPICQDGVFERGQ